MPSETIISPDLPGPADIAEGFDRRILLVCDVNTAPLARSIPGAGDLPACVLAAGEANKGWAAVETILAAAVEAGLGRDGLMVGVGGGVVTDLCAFAASIYMRGTALRLVSTTLLGMVDAALGGKAGFDLFGIKNLAGTFRPADRVYMPLRALRSLPEREWRSGLAEAVKTAILGDEDLFALLEARREELAGVPAESGLDLAAELVGRCVAVKGGIVQADPEERGGDRALLNLGHTFGHALESAAGLGRVSHGEAVAWGMVRAVELGRALGLTPTDRARRIADLLAGYGYELRAPHPLAPDAEALLAAMGADKKKKDGRLNFIVPTEDRATQVGLEPAQLAMVKAILQGDAPS